MTSIIDAGNANFPRHMRRFEGLEGLDLTFIGMGVSGGEEGARHGPSIMVGGNEPSLEPVEAAADGRFSAQVPDGGPSPCRPPGWAEKNGAGHLRQNHPQRH